MYVYIRCCTIKQCMDHGREALSEFFLKIYIFNIIQRVKMIFDRLVCIGSWSKCIVSLSLMTRTVEAGFPDGICGLFTMSKWGLIFTIQPLRSASPLSSPHS